MHFSSIFIHFLPISAYSMQFPPPIPRCHSERSRRIPYSDAPAHSSPPPKRLSGHVVILSLSKNPLCRGTLPVPRHKKGSVFPIEAPISKGSRPPQKKRATARAPKHKNRRAMTSVLQRFLSFSHARNLRPAIFVRGVAIKLRCALNAFLRKPSGAEQF